MKQYDIAVRYTNSSEDQFIFNRMSMHWETDAETVEEFISELVAESYDFCNIAYDIKEVVENPLIDVWAYDVAECEDGCNVQNAPHTIRIEPYMYENMVS